MLGLFETLDKSKANPGLYLGKPSVSDLLWWRSPLNLHEMLRLKAS
jgi:hypothetical protein